MMENYDWFSAINKSDMIVLMYTDINLNNLGDGFIEKAFKHYYPVSYTHLDVYKRQVLIGWVFFKIEDLKPSLNYLKKMFVWRADSKVWQPTLECWLITILAFIFSFFTVSELGKKLQSKVYFDEYSVLGHVLLTTFTIVLYFFLVGHILTETFNPFIYFRF